MYNIFYKFTAHIICNDFFDMVGSSLIWFELSIDCPFDVKLKCARDFLSCIFFGSLTHCEAFSL